MTQYNGRDITKTRVLYLSLSDICLHLFICKMYVRKNFRQEIRYPLSRRCIISSRLRHQILIYHETLMVNISGLQFQYSVLYLDLGSVFVQKHSFGFQNFK